MKRILPLFFAMAALALLSGCATIIGGSKYFASVKIEDHPNAKIYYQGDYQGSGDAEISVKRSHADEFSLIVKENGCADQQFDFTQKKFRTWAFVGTLVGWTGIFPGTYIPLPWGIAVDMATGALWKPDENEKGIQKVDFKQYNYILDYKGCDQKNQ